jgi:hypothetical protein
MPAPVEGYRREQAAARVHPVGWRHEIPTDLDRDAPRRPPDRLPVPTALLLIVAMSLLLWLILGAGAAWLVGWL